MGTSYISEGCVVTLTAPSGGVTKDVPVLIGRLLVIPQNTVAETLQFDGYVSGIHKVTKVGSQAWTEGANVYWDDTNKYFTTTATSNQYAGVAVAAVGSGAGAPLRSTDRPRAECAARRWRPFGAAQALSEWRTRRRLALARRRRCRRARR